MANEKMQKPKYNMGQNTWFMTKLAWKSREKKVIVLGVLSALLAVALNLINLYIVPSILAVVEAQASVSVLLGRIGLFVLALILTKGLSEYVNENVLYGRITVRTELITMMQRKASTTSFPNLFEDRYQKLCVKAQESVEANSEATEAIWMTLTDLCRDIVGFVIYVLLLSTVQPVLILAILVTSTAAFLMTNYATQWMFSHRDEAMRYERNMNYLSRDVSGREYGKDMRIFGLRGWVEQLYAKAQEALIAYESRVQSRYLWARVLDLVLTFLRNAVAYAYLIGLVLFGEIDISQFLLYFGAIEGFAAWVTGILGGLNTLNKQSTDITTVREYLEYPEKFRFEEGRSIKKTENGDYEIRMENVSFRYPGAEKDTLSGINLVLHPGEKLAIVGLNGAGKTTLVKLICGFLDPTGGCVLLNGEDIREFDRKKYYEMFSAVFQDFSLLAGSVATNVAQEIDGIDMDRVKDCIARAGLSKKIESLKDGYETYLNRAVYEDAVLLSGGETQRLMLARALYKDAPFIVLDEPTAALDPIAESEMYQKYNEMTEGKSSVYISHRLASTRFCDRIILIGNGGISEEGTHDELLKAGGEYARLFEVQSKYYKEGEGENEEEQE